MPSQVVFWIAILIAAFMAILFLRRRGQKEPSRLRLVTKGGKAVSTDVKTNPRSRSPKREYVSAETVEASTEGGRIKSLNVIFNYNGHSWDAYEVLGIPAGAPPKMVNDAFARAIKETDPKSHSFLKAALHAIQNS